MLKDFIKHIQATPSPFLAKVQDADFLISNDGKATQVQPVIEHPDTLGLHSLDALIKMVKTELKPTVDAPVYITIPDHLTVRCFAQPDAGKRYHRQFFYEVKATDVPGWDTKVQLGFEEAQIALRTRFQETEDTLYAMKLLSDICTGAKVVYNDNGIATTITTQKGVALQGSAQIKPIVTLKPFRTFQEVAQPESIFLIRVNDRGISFTEADGGMWKLRARGTIKWHIEYELKDLVEDGSVVVAL